MNIEPRRENALKGKSRMGRRFLPRIPDNMDYIAVMLDSNSKSILRTLVKNCDFDMSDLVEFFFSCEHLNVLSL